MLEIVSRPRGLSFDQVGVCSAVAHYIKAVDAVGMLDVPLLPTKIREPPVNDVMTDNARIAGTAG